MLIEKKDAIFALKLLRNRFDSAGLGEAVNAITLAMGEIDRLNEVPPKFYLIDETKKEARGFEGTVVDADSSADSNGLGGAR